jgi:hypothetical protein
MRFPQKLFFAFAGSVLLVSCKTGSGPSAGPAAPGDSGTSTAPEGTPRTAPDLIANYEKLADDILETRSREVKIVRSILEATYKDAQRTLEEARKAVATGNNAAAKDHIEDLAMLVGYLATEGDGSVARVRKRLVEGGHHFNPLLNQPEGPGGAEGGAGHHAGDKAHHAAGDKAHAAGDKAHADAKGHAADKGHAEGQGHAAGPGEPGAKDAGAAKDKAHHAGSPHHAEGQHHGEGHHGAEGARGYDPGYVVVNRGAKRTLMDSSRALAKLAQAPSAAELDKEWARVEETWKAVQR